MPADVLKHATRLLDSLKSVVHAKLHRDDVEWLREFCGGKGFGERLGVTIQRSKISFEPWGTH